MFIDFIKRVLNAVKGRLSVKDINMLKRVLNNQGKKYLVFSRAILTAVSSSEDVNKKDLNKFASLLKKAEERIARGMKPFTEKEKKELKNILVRAKIGPRVTRMLTKGHIDEILIVEVRDNMTKSKMIENMKITKMKKGKSESKKKSQKTNKKVKSVKSVRIKPKRKNKKRKMKLAGRK